MASERVDEEVGRIVNCINSCWPEYAFTHLDIRKPSGEKFRDVLGRFLKGFLGYNYQLSHVSLVFSFFFIISSFAIGLFQICYKINMHELSRNPEMFVHFESTMSLFREINNILKSVGCTSLRFGELRRPSLSILYSWEIVYSSQT